MDDATARQLLAHAPFVHALARSLVGDAMRADDVAQEAWLAALRGAPRDPTTHRRWLSGVVRNLSRRARREEGRRARRERDAARPEYVRPTAEIAEREEARRSVVDAVLSLREPYRTAILLRYYDDLPPREIAARLGVRGSTVRSRLQRGIAELRDMLDRQHRGDRRAWCLALLPLAAPSRGAAALALGGIAVKTKLLVAAALCALAGLLFLGISPSGGSAAQRAEAVVAESGAPPATVAVPATPGPAPQPDAGTAVLLEGSVTGGPGGDVRVEVSPGPAGEGLVAATVAVDQPFRIDVRTLFAASAPEGLRVVARREGFLDAEARVGVALSPGDGRPVLAHVRLALVPASTLRGGVRAPGGAPVPAATVALFDLVGGAPVDPAVAAARADADGGFRLDVHGGEFLVVAVAPRCRPAWARVALRDACALDLEPLVVAGGERIGGRVTMGGSAAAAGATVTAQIQDPGPWLAVPRTPWRLAWRDGRVVHATLGADAGDDGRYAIEGLEAKEPYVVAVTALEGAHYGAFQGRDGPLYARREAAPAAGVDFDLSLCRVEVAVRRAGRGIAGATVRATDARPQDAYAEILDTDDQGRLALLARPGADFVLDVEAEGFEGQRVERALPGAGGRLDLAIELEPRHERATLLVSFEPEGDAPLPVAFRFRREDGEEISASADRGLYALRDLDPGDYVFTALAGGGDAREEVYLLPAELRVRLEAGAAERLAVPLKLGGRLVVVTRTPEGRTDVEALVSLADATGRDVSVAFAKYTDTSASVTGGRLLGRAGPGYLHRPLAPGRYVLTIRPEDEGLGERTVDVAIEPGRTATVEVALERR